MEDFTVSLFGHREIDDLWGVQSKLAPIVKDLVRTKPYVSFLIGRNGEFDECAASVIKRAKKEVGEEKCELVLVLPYKVARIDDYEKYYDNLIIPESIYGAHPKVAITMRNRFMVEKSDLVIVYVAREKGGAYEALKYAKKLNKNVLNVYTDEE